MNEFITLNELCSRWRISRETARVKTNEGKMPPRAKMLSKKVLYALQDVIDWEKKTKGV